MPTLRDIEAQLYNHPAVKLARRVRDDGSRIVYEVKYTIDGISISTMHVNIEVFNRSMPNEEAYFVGGVPPFLLDYSFCRDADAYIASKVDGINVIGYHKVFCDEHGGVAEYDLYRLDQSGAVIVDRRVVYSDGTLLKDGGRV